VALVASLAPSACSSPRDDQPYAGACTPLQAVEWTPRNGQTGVARDTVVRVRFDAYPDPDTVGLGALIVTTGLYYHPGAIGLDLVDKAITYAPASGWRPDLGYDVNVRAALTSLQGCAVVPEQHTFRTTTAAPSAPAPVAPITYADVRPLFAQRCSGAACHRALTNDGGGCLAAPAAGLSLCDAEIVGALLGVPSRQVSRLELVADRDSTRSYLLRKLLPGDRPDEPAPTTLGHRDPPGDPLSTDELHLVARWIDDGLAP